MLARLRVILSAAPTYILLVAFIVRAILEEVAQGAGLPSWVAAGGAALLAGLGALVAIIRRVTEVLPSARGMLPTPPEQPTTAREANLTRELSAARREFP